MPKLSLTLQRKTNFETAFSTVLHTFSGQYSQRGLDPSDFYNIGGEALKEYPDISLQWLSRTNATDIPVPFRAELYTRMAVAETMVINMSFVL